MKEEINVITIIKNNKHIVTRDEVGYGTLEC